MRLQATVGGGFAADKERPRSPTAPEPRRYTGRRDEGVAEGTMRSTGRRACREPDCRLLGRHSNPSLGISTRRSAELAYRISVGFLPPHVGHESTVLPNSGLVQPPGFP